MLQKVLMDYREGFRWSRFKETYHYTMIGWYLYMMCFFPILMGLNDKTERIGGYYLAIIPLLFGMYSLAAIPIRLPKQMFLCPLTKKERKKYVSLLFGVRYFGTVIPGMIAYGIAAALGWIRLELLPVHLIGLFAALFCASITTWPGSIWEQNEKEKKRLKNPAFKGLYPISIIGMILAVFLQFLELSELIETLNAKTWVFLGIYCAVVIVFALLLIRYINPVLDMAIVYENSYDVVNNKELKSKQI